MFKSIIAILMVVFLFMAQGPEWTYCARHKKQEKQLQDKTQKQC